MSKLQKFMDRTEQMMVAATFAQANCPRTAREIMNEKKRSQARRPVQRSRVTPDQRPVLRV